MKVILWDFDGTLGHRSGMWRSCLVETLDEQVAGHGIDADQLRPFLRDRFPWHRPEVAHLELCEPGAWWRHIEAVLAEAYRGVGFDDEHAQQLARDAGNRYVDPSRGWCLYDDTLPVLEQLHAAGWTYGVLSNHIPELPDLLDGLGLSSLIEFVHTSAITGYEKPHRKAFEIALERCGNISEVWMVGDNPIADVAGAEAAGIPAILVRTESGQVARRASDLYEAAALIGLRLAPGA